MSQSSAIEGITSSLSDNKVHLLLAASGSVATIKLPLIVKTLSERYSQPAQGSSSQQQDSAHGGLSIRILLTPSAARFLDGQSAEQPRLQSLLDIPGVDGIHLDEDEWREPWKRGNAILHIELRRWADMLVVAPLSANTMAKIVNGFADGILTSVIRAWDARGELDTDVVRGGGSSISSNGAVRGEEQQQQASRGPITRQRSSRKKRIIVAPAMNTAMWRHPVTAKQLRVLEEEWGVAGEKEAMNGGDRGQTPSAGSRTDTEEADRNIARDGAKESEEQENDGWFEVLRPQHKILACGDIGDGAMMEWTEIVAIIEDRLGLSS
ncbi:flavoprotein-domain-containing protein [Microdochium trichocladiopsis]|uniref:Flavoprotein-domain-containing protein n=1 Tax=Microdochium trichocladiopsis TaxID=1682393 RepID=A0A9P8XZN2_9PEZI|nr:flavoprotein-domain-containing protein [Microdochium trichocladiopsis]KAH7025806.1 flavoprotein-domain-containing protein [Microdochium trichocladiopsis]